MTPENVGETDKIEICYHPKDIIDFFERHGPFTSKDLRNEFDFSQTAADWIIIDLHSLKIVDSSDEDWLIDEEEQVAYRTYHLTEQGRQEKDGFKVRRTVLTPMPSFAKLSMGVVNDVSQAAVNLGMSLEELTTKVRSGELDEKIQQRVLEVLGEFSGDELRGLAKEKRLFGRDSKPSNQS